MRRYVVLKIAGTTAFTALFFVGYFHLLRFPAYTVTVMPLTALDHLIPFQPNALFVYLTLWLYIGVGPGLLLGFVELLAYTLWISAMCLVGLGVFYVWPTAVPAANLDVAGLAGFAMLKGVDAAGNACPSMHVAAAMFTAIRVDRTLREARVPAALRLMNALWMLAIAHSTLAIKQHVLLDVVAGAALGAAFALASLYARPGARPRAGPGSGA